MVLALTATVDQSIWAVRLEAIGGTGTVEFYRSRLGQDVYLGSSTGDPALWVDYGPDLNVAHDYYASDDTDTDVVTGITVASDVPVLSSTTSPIAAAVVVVAYRPYTAEARSTVHRVLGREDPLVVIHPFAYPTGTITFYAAANSDRVKLYDMIRLGETMHLRSSCPDRLDTFYFQPLQYTDPFMSDDRRSGPSYVEIEFQATGVPTGIVPPDASRTYQTWVDVHPTYQDVLTTWADYRAALDG